MTTSQQIALALAILAGLLVYLQVLSMLIAWWSGWRALAAQFHHDFDFRNQIGGWQSARMRWGCHYNNALKIAVDDQGLSLATIAIVPRHPPMLIPWNQVAFVGRSKFFSWTFVTFNLGFTQHIPFAVSENLARQIQSAPGAPPHLIPKNE